MVSDDYQWTLADYLSVLRRRAVLIAGSFTALLAASVAVVMLVPPVYLSSGTIIIESQQIPTELVQATVTSYADERIEVIKQRVMTRENLLRIIGKYRLFQDERGRLTPSEQIDEMRKDTRVELIQAELRPGQRGNGTIAFKVSFEHRRPETAQGVTNELVTLFLDENVKVRTERATQTTEFLKQESERLRSELDKLEAQIAAYKQANGRTLPDNMALAMASMQRLESDLRDVEREYRSAAEELRHLDDERATALSLAGRGIAGPGGSAAGTAAADLQRARAELARLQATYTDSHPDVRSLKRRIDNLAQAVAAERPSTDGPEGTKDPAVARIDTRIAGARARMNVLETQQAALRSRLAQAEAQVVNAPQVERGLAALTRDYQAAQRKYEEIRAKQGTAQVAENLEGEQKAERFALLEPPTVPDKPVKPDRRKLLALAVALSAAGSAALVLMAEALHGTVRGFEAMAGLLGQRPLVTVPYMAVAAEAEQRRRLVLISGAACLVALAVMVAGLHFFYLPLELLVPKIMLRIA